MHSITEKSLIEVATRKVSNMAVMSWNVIEVKPELLMRNLITDEVQQWQWKMIEQQYGDNGGDEDDGGNGEMVTTGMIEALEMKMNTEYKVLGWVLLRVLGEQSQE
ncbi:hypothetical protein RCL_jg8270.t1 [Rhizophagus clarus]|uniref:Uncharacterized protein n=1 Tax=Rhizophagus clarus TaxID=94130 RepID=A0A8H3R4H0_9GLOM|nr:hypothetical protein RCL_jg8270.t1 [Rhizophagus clarus]